MPPVPFRPVVVPFITSSTEATLSMGVKAICLHIIPGSYGTLDESLALKGTKVLMKCGKSFPRVRQKLRDLGLADNARMIENCGFESQRIYTNLEEADESAGYFSVIVIKDPN